MAFPQPPLQSQSNDTTGRFTSVWQSWITRAQSVLNAVTLSGNTSSRPTKDLYVGQPFFDSTLNQVVWWNGSEWIKDAPATTGTSILSGDGNGGFTNVTIGTGLFYVNHTLSGTGGTLTTLSVDTANGFAGTVTTPSTTPEITLSTTVTGMVKGNGTALSAATSGVDFAPPTSGTSILYGNGSGGFSNVTIGSGVSFAGGTLSATGSGGTVTSVTGTAPIASTGGTTPVISISQSGASSNGYLSSTDWNTFNNKQPSGTYVTSVSGTAPVVSSGGTTPAISMAAANGSTNGYLTSTDWTTFNNKQPAGTYVTSVTGSGNIASSGGTTPNITFTGTLPIANGGTNGTATPTAGAVAVGTGTAYGFTAAGSAGQVLTSNGSSTPTWATVATGIGQTGYWGSFYDTTNQTLSAANTAYPININSSDPTSNGVSIVSGNRITFAYAGVYTIQYSVQLANADNQIHTSQIWLRKNGTTSASDVADSASTFSITSSHSGTPGYNIATVIYTLTLNAGDYLILYWEADSTQVSLSTIAAGTSPVTPVSPCIIVTAFPVTQVGIGYYNLTSVSSVTIGTGSQTFTVNLSNTSTAFTVGTRVRVAYVTTPANFMEGVITSFSGTTMIVNVDSIGGSGTYANWTVSVAGIQGSNGVTSITGTANQVIVSASTGAVTLSLPQSISTTSSPTFNIVTATGGIGGGTF